MNVSGSMQERLGMSRLPLCGKFAHNGCISDADVDGFGAGRM